MRRKADNGRDLAGKARLAKALGTSGRLGSLGGHGGVVVLLGAVKLANDDAAVVQAPAKICEVRLVIDGVAKLNLQVRGREAQLPHCGAGNGLAAALGPAVGKGRQLAGAPNAGALLLGLHPTNQLVLLDKAQAQGRVKHRNSITKSQLIGTVEKNSLDAQHGYAANKSALGVIDVDVARDHGAVVIALGPAGTGHMELPQGRIRDRKAIGHGGGRAGKPPVRVDLGQGAHLLDLALERV